MNDIKCKMIQDLIILYVDDVLSDESKIEIEDHIKECKECREYLRVVKNEDKIELKSKVIELDNELIENSGEIIINKIKRYQDKIKYTLLIFSTIIAVFSISLFRGIWSTIPFIIIIPLVLRTLYNDSRVIFATAIITQLIVGLYSEGFSYAIVTMPFIIICISGGLVMRSLAKVLVDRRG